MGTKNITTLVGTVLAVKVVKPNKAAPIPKPTFGIFQELLKVLLKSLAISGFMLLYRSTYSCNTSPIFCFAFKIFNLKISP